MSFYSPHREGGTMHLPSPTHHGYRLEGAHFSSIQQLRRSLSRSPSKPSRFHLRTNKTDSPVSPLALNRAFSPRAHKPTSPIAADPESPFASQAPPTTKKKFSLRRVGPFRSSPRNRAAKSPRRALVDSTGLGNALHSVSRPLFGEENMPNAPQRKPSVDFWDSPASQSFIDDKPIKFEFARTPQASSNAPGANCFQPTQPSPLKRRDTNTGFDSRSCETPNPKRRSLHAGIPSTTDFLFDTPAPRQTAEMPSQPQDNDLGLNLSSPHQAAASTQSPRRTPLRRAASQRAKPDNEFAKPIMAASRMRMRNSLDGSAMFASTSGPPESPFARPQPPQLRGGSGQPGRHPLANQVNASSSSSSLGDESPQPDPFPAISTPRVPSFSKSLPIGAARPTEESGQPLATPFAARLGHLRRDAAQSTGGLQSKKHRNVEDLVASFVVPDTPTKANDSSKRASYPPSAGCSPMPHRRATMLFGVPAQKRPEFGTPSTPFSTHPPKTSSESFGKGVGIFGSLTGSHQRRGSFVSVDDDCDIDLDDDSNSPIGKHMTDSQSSVDDMPPTPTKHNDGSGRRSKESSLRRRTFKSRATVGNDTFAGLEARGIDIPADKANLNPTPSGVSPRTPNESFIPPDPSNLSISGHRRDSHSVEEGAGSGIYQPPMTPTAPRDQQFNMNAQQPVVPFGLTKNDVDPTITSRFRRVEPLGGAQGAFSEVFKVSQPIKPLSPHGSPAGNQVWVVKRSKARYGGPRDRERKLREVEILKALREGERIVRYEDHFEADERLYIQTEYCDNGNLANFLIDQGYESRLDDFRIWKLLLDLSMGLDFIHKSGFIHLDLKPANVLIDFGGWIKIADFGLATSYPVTEQLEEHEGDRQYLAKESMQHIYGPFSDVFSLGIIMAEIAGNLVLPDNGESWHDIRSGQSTLLPSLTWSSESSLARHPNGKAMTQEEMEAANVAPPSSSGYGAVAAPNVQSSLQHLLAAAPPFMIDASDKNSLDWLVHYMIHPTIHYRPSAEAVWQSYGCQWVAQRRQAGATVYEGNFGPATDVVKSFDGFPDVMDTS